MIWHHWILVSGVTGKVRSIKKIIINSWEWITVMDELEHLCSCKRWPFVKGGFSYVLKKNEIKATSFLYIIYCQELPLAWRRRWIHSKHQTVGSLRNFYTRLVWRLKVFRGLITLSDRLTNSLQNPLKISTFLKADRNSTENISIRTHTMTSFFRICFAEYFTVKSHYKIGENLQNAFWRFFFVMFVIKLYEKKLSLSYKIILWFFYPLCFKIKGQYPYFVISLITNHFSWVVTFKKSISFIVLMFLIILQKK